MPTPVATLKPYHSTLFDPDISTSIFFSSVSISFWVLNLNTYSPKLSMCQFFNDRYTRCGHEVEREVRPCTSFMLVQQCKYCPNRKDNTTNTYIKELCVDCKNLGPRPPVPIFPEYDYSRLTVKRLYSKNMYAKPGEKLVLKETESKTLAALKEREAVTSATVEEAQMDTAKLKVPKVMLNDDAEPPGSMSSSWTEVDADLEGEGVLVSPPNEEELAEANPKNKNKMTKSKA